MDLLEYAGETLESLFVDICSFCECHGLCHGLCSLQMSDFGVVDSFSYAHFGGKGFSCKILATYLAAKLQKHPGLERQALCCWNLVEFQRVVDGASMFLTEAEAAAAVTAGQTFLNFWQELAAENMANLRANYKVRPKHHAFAHYVIHRIRTGSRLNPRVTSCWMDEDFIGRVCRSARGTHPSSLARRTLERHVLEVNRRLSERRSKTNPLGR